MAAELDPAVEQQLAELSDDDWRSLSARVRRPTSSQRLREMAAKHISGDQLETLMAITDPKRFAGENGDIDEGKLTGHLSTLFGSGAPHPQHQWGQHSGGSGPGLRPGDRGRAEAARRSGRVIDHEIQSATTGVECGGAGRAEAARRNQGQPQ